MKITEEIAAQIREKFEQGYTVIELAEEYELNKSTISRIINNKIWVQDVQSN